MTNRTLIILNVLSIALNCSFMVMSGLWLAAIALVMNVAVLCSVCYSIGKGRI